MTDNRPQNMAPANTEAPRTNRKTYLGLAAAFIGGIGIIFAMSALKEHPEPEPVVEPPPPKVTTISATPNEEQLTIMSQGAVIPVRQISVIAEVAGRVTSISDHFEVGEFFNSDETLISIDARDYHVALQQAELSLAQAKEQHAMEKGEASQAKKQWRDVGNKEANALFLRKPQLARAKASVVAAEANVQQAKLNVDRTQLSVPFNGRVLSKRVDVGQFVTAGTVLAEVYGTDAVFVRLPLTQQQAAKVNLPLTPQSQEQTETDFPSVTLKAAYGDEFYDWQGRIVRTEASLDTRSRVIYAVVQIDNPYAPAEEGTPPLAVGMYVSAEIEGKHIQNAYRLPRTALYKNDQVLLVDDNDQLAIAKINVEEYRDDQVIVTGLEKGQRIMVSKLPQVIAGLPVTPVDEANIATVESSQTPITDNNQKEG
ncbi:efflux RND transporter periplasmic adaptor subunit [Marinibactrum halimedae]|uniref:Multidrug resistance protein MdtA-like barrel-sandwich hybrid domain-containing protein n=1 Tax=Marinibactrum halimedae TaxID=1444977 RepID=A0AA37T9D7_9GAMM|nr:efflux RND transporter periplasmic adaptor subunit [Marinibactrum halimedae]MCD9458703.1 efflux RND transporter periplasmic adaptor subunit [Marinibactrum halimedae]GLS25930.1 hypothetical protein GCM10007877_16450 [Marinibactrum halimedae]